MGKPVKLEVRGDRKNEPFAKKVIASVELHQKLLGLEDWYGHLVFGKVEFEDGGEGMETECWPQYRKFEITVDVDTFAKSQEYLNHYVRHECLHVLLWSYFGMAGDLCYKNAEKALRKQEETAIYDLEHMPLWDLIYEKVESIRLANLLD